MTPRKMKGVLLTGHGGLEKLEYRTDLPVPQPKANEVLIRVAAAGVNNTDINTRLGWYSKSIKGATEAGAITTSDDDGGWSGTPMTFPRIQGADVCGNIEAVGAQVDGSRIGQRVLIRNMLRSYVDYRPYECWTLGSECDGGFAEFVVAPSREVYAVECDWPNAALAAIPCAYSTAENMLHRAQAGEERVLITGASGGVGSAAIQLAKRRGAHVTALASPAKAAAVRALGADAVFARMDNPAEKIGRGRIDVVIDLVGGTSTQALLETLTRGGRYASAGAIGGPLAEIDLRTLYLNDLTYFGCTFQTDEVFENLILYIEAGEINMPEPRIFPLEGIAQAQKDFMDKVHIGKFVLVP